MIHINIVGKNPPIRWCQKAEELKEELLRIESPEERKRVIERNQRHWAKLKNWLLKLSYGKCWYSESKELVSDYHVDHFRPKFRAKNLDESQRDGYWWLAFDWKNYRISGSICNSLHCGADGETHGKADYFPLKDGCIPATSPVCNLEAEEIYLLDPTNPRDPSLLSFEETGNSMPVGDEGTWDFERADKTIKILHLNHIQLVEGRIKIWANCRLLMKIANSMKTQEEEKTELIDEISEALKKVTSPESELSSAARACLLSSGNIWAKDLVDR